MRKTLLILTLLCSIVVNAQEKEESEAFLFEKKLTLETDKDSIKKHINIIKGISVASNLDSITLDSKWKLLYFHQTGWFENMPNDRHYVNSLYLGKNNKIISSQDLLKAFKISNQKEILLNQFPAEFTIEPRGAPLNGKWTIIFIKNNHITLQNIHSYPNGNQSSWFRKINCYLKKIN